jgi:hypothetical protein
MNIDDSTKSKTNKVNEYYFKDKRTGIEYILIDTPGYMDTAGL